MKSLISIPHGLTHGDDLVVLRKTDYDALQRKITEFKDALGKIKRGEKEYRNGRTRMVSSLEDLTELRP